MPKQIADANGGLIACSSAAGEPPADLVRKGTLLVMPASGERISLAEANAVLDEGREERADCVGDPTRP